MTTLAACPLCGSRDTEIHGGVVYCEGEYCYLRAASLQEWNDLARLIEIGRMVEAMPRQATIRVEIDGVDCTIKATLEALRKAARDGKWKVER